ncbi:MAG: hypothetical protein OHK0012_03890 [Synechococcales cyanobacterium]
MVRKVNITPRIDTDTGRLIVERMNALGLTWRELSRRTQLSSEGIKLICAGRHSPTLEHIVKIAQALNIHTGELIDVLQKFASTPTIFETNTPQPLPDLLAAIETYTNVSELLSIQDRINRRLKELTNPDAPETP